MYMILLIKIFSFSKTLSTIILIGLHSKFLFLGEVSLVYCVPRRVSLRAVNYVDLFSLTKTDLDEVLENFPDIKADIQSQAQKRFRHIIDALKRGK